MRFYTLSPNVPENPVLFPLMRPTFIEQRHYFVNSVELADIVMWDLHTRIADYDQNVINEIIRIKKPIAIFDEYDKGGLSSLIYPNPLTNQQQEVFDFIGLNNIKTVHFCRLFDKTKNYPENYYPYEKPYLHDEGLLTADQLFNRPYDIVWIANSAPQREMFKQILEEDGRLKCKIILGAEKLPLQGWIDAHKEGKMFVSWSAGGYGDEKIQHLFSVAATIKENNNQLFLHDFTHLENCLRPNTIPTKKDIDTIVEVVRDKEKLYPLYKNNYDFVKTFYSKEYIANDILQKILKHCA